MHNSGPMNFANRFKLARKAKRLSQAAIARQLKITREAVSQWERGKSTPPPTRMGKLAELLGRGTEWLATGRGRGDTVEGLPLCGDVAAGVWSEPRSSQEAEFERVPVAPDPRYPVGAQYALKVRGNSVNKVAGDGAIVACVDILEAGMDPRPGDLVVVERKRGGLVEATVKRLRATEGVLELWPESDDPSHQDMLPLRPVKGETEVVIRAVVIGIYVPVLRGA